jgi:hypothetical protein
MTHWAIPEGWFRLKFLPSRKPINALNQWDRAKNSSPGVKVSVKSVDVPIGVEPARDAWFLNLSLRETEEASGTHRDTWHT